MKKTCFNCKNICVDVFKKPCNKCNPKINDKWEINQEERVKTGIKDVEGKEIFAGDILRFGDIGTWHDSKVWLENGEFYIDDDGTKTLLSDIIDYCLSTKIIGNIYEEAAV